MSDTWRKGRREVYLTVEGHQSLKQLAALRDESLGKAAEHAIELAIQREGSRQDRSKTQEEDPP